MRVEVVLVLAAAEAVAVAVAAAAAVEASRQTGKASPAAALHRSDRSDLRERRGSAFTRYC